jgi:hypothetical protein
LTFEAGISAGAATGTAASAGVTDAGALASNVNSESEPVGAALDRVAVPCGVSRSRKPVPLVVMLSEQSLLS